MSTSKILRDIATLCKESAKECTDAKFALGGRPDDPIKAQYWSVLRNRLSNQIRTLDALSIEITAASVALALKDHAEDLKAISESTKEAKKQIRQIKDAAKLLSKIAKVIELGTAVIAAATGPSTATIGAVVKAAQAVIDPEPDKKDAARP